MKLLRSAMKMHRILAIIAFVCALIGGLLVVISALGGFGRLSLASTVGNGLELLFGLGAIFGGWLIYTGLKRMGGMLTLFAGIVLLILTGGFGTPVLLVMLAGVLGLVAAEMKPWWAFWR